MYTIGQFSKIGKISTKALRYYDEIDKDVRKSQQLRSLIELKIKKIESGGNLMETKHLKVELKEKETFIVISRRATTRIENISTIIGKVFEDICQMNLQAAGPVMTVYYDKEFDAENADIEICIPVNKKVKAEKSDKLKEFAGGLTACTTFVGPYSRLGEAYSKVMKWIEENGYENSGAPYDIYLTGPGTANNPDQFVTEVCFPVTRS